MRKACGETYPGDWDNLLPWFIFAYREVPVEGFGYSFSNYYLAETSNFFASHKNVMVVKCSLR